MGLLPIDKRGSDLLVEEVKKLTKTADEIESLANAHNIPQLTPLADRVRDAVDVIEKELARRAGD